jgi:hypothetical protein
MALRQEADAVLTTALFRKSPVLSRLLRYLVEQTAQERANTLKSFAVAVDGLGRPPSFDPAADSSARVQMVRLRKALESHYAQHGATGELCMYLQPGSYQIRMGKLAVAYPMLYRPLSAPLASRTADAETGHAPVAPQTLTAASPSGASRTWLMAGAALTGIVLALLAVFAWRAVGPTNQSQLSPILELMPVDAGGDPQLAGVARAVSGTFADGLPRFKLARVRVPNKGDAPVPINENEPVYRLYFQLENNDQSGTVLFLRLNDARTNTLIWSREAAIPVEPKAAANALIPLLAEVNGPFGIVATHSAGLYKDVNSGGYPCLVKYFSFLKTRDAATEEQVAECFQKPVEEMRIRATILAARAFFVIEHSAPDQNMATANRQAIEFARAAIAEDPNDAAARYAMARLSYLSGDCVSARFYTQQAVDANAISPIILATLASLAQECGYPDAEALLDQAYVAQSAGNADGRLLLILASVAQNRPEKISELKPSSIPAAAGLRLNYYLSEALIAASQNRQEDAARYWQQFSDSTSSGLKTPDEKLQRIILIPKMRRRLITYLGSKGALDDTVSAKK